MHDDSERISRRFCSVFGVVAAQAGVPVSLSPEQIELVTETFNELLRAEVLFPGPSLYAEP